MKGSHSFKAAPSAAAVTNLGQVRFEKTFMKNAGQPVEMNLYYDCIHYQTCRCKLIAKRFNRRAENRRQRKYE